MGDDVMLDAYVLLTRGKKQGISLELEGTNSEGDLGFGVGLTYQHRNLARGSELLTAKFRTSYESLSGDFNGLINNRYMEYAGEVGITFPQFEAPFLSYNFKQKVRATTEFAVSFNYQERPGYSASLPVPPGNIIGPAVRTICVTGLTSWISTTFICHVALSTS